MDDLITCNGKGRIALDSPITSVILNRQAQENLQSIPDVLESEIRVVGSNSIANLTHASPIGKDTISTTDAACPKLV
ncbi:hypothetical protein PverR02_11935 [Pseudomonas veronii]|nr:hypothetical protein PverR02_11935 [Pseudomonas veronii]